MPSLSALLQNISRPVYSTVLTDNSDEPMITIMRNKYIIGYLNGARLITSE